MDNRQFAGWVESADGGVLQGWAANLAAPEAPADLSVYVDGRLGRRGRCEGLRLDAVAAGFPGARRFRLDVSDLIGPDTARIEVAFEGSDQRLSNGVVSVQPRPAAAPAQIGDYWSGHYAASRQRITRWWECEHIVQHINQRVCGQRLPGTSAGLHQKALERFADQVPFGRAISVGCGKAGKERAVLRCGLAEHFTLYEFSPVAIEMGRAQAQAEGLSERMDFRLGDAFALETVDGGYDLVYWNNALHHMFDVEAALDWSWRMLRPGGVLLMDDFVGPDRMQWPDEMLRVNTQVRECLPEAYLANPFDPATRLPTRVERPSERAIIALDPSECADSARILPALQRRFPGAWVLPTGGAVYHLGLNDVLHHLVAAGDLAMLDQILRVDDECIAAGMTHYAVAIAVKS